MYNGTASSGTTTDGNLEAKLLGLEEVIRIGVGIILLNFEEPTSWSAEVEGDGIFLLMYALTKGGSSTLVTPTMGTWGGETIIDSVVSNSIVLNEVTLKIEVWMMFGIWWSSSICLRI